MATRKEIEAEIKAQGAGTYSTSEGTFAVSPTGEVTRISSVGTIKEFTPVKVSPKVEKEARYDPLEVAKAQAELKKDLPKEIKDVKYEIKNDQLVVTGKVEEKAMKRTEDIIEEPTKPKIPEETLERLKAPTVTLPTVKPAVGRVTVPVIWKGIEPEKRMEPTEWEYTVGMVAVRPRKYEERVYFKPEKVEMPIEKFKVSPEMEIVSTIIFPKYKEEFAPAVIPVETTLPVAPEKVMPKVPFEAPSKIVVESKMPTTSAQMENVLKGIPAGITKAIATPFFIGAAPSIEEKPAAYGAELIGASLYWGAVSGALARTEYPTKFVKEIKKAEFRIMRERPLLIEPAKEYPMGIAIRKEVPSVEWYSPVEIERMAKGIKWIETYPPITRLAPPVSRIKEFAYLAKAETFEKMLPKKIEVPALIGFKGEEIRTFGIWKKDMERAITYAKVAPSMKPFEKIVIPKATIEAGGGLPKAELLKTGIRVPAVAPTPYWVGIGKEYGPMFWFPPISISITEPVMKMETVVKMVELRDMGKEMERTFKKEMKLEEAYRREYKLEYKPIVTPRMGIEYMQLPERAIEFKQLQKQEQKMKVPAIPYEVGVPYKPTIKIPRKEELRWPITPRRRVRKGVKYPRRKKRYVPSVGAILTGTTVSIVPKWPTPYLTGLTMRPIYKPKRGKRKTRRKIKRRRRRQPALAVKKINWKVRI